MKTAFRGFMALLALLAAYACSLKGNLWGIVACLLVVGFMGWLEWESKR